MILLELAVWVLLGLVLSTVQLIAQDEPRPLDVLTVGIFGALIGGAAGRQLSDPQNSGVFNLFALISACALSLGGLFFFDVIRESKEQRR